jgi:hypothetical protein
MMSFLITIGAVALLVSPAAAAGLAAVIVIYAIGRALADARQCTPEAGAEVVHHHYYDVTYIVDARHLYLIQRIEQ